MRPDSPIVTATMHPDSPIELADQAQPGNTLHAENAVTRRASTGVEDFAALTAAAKDASVEEQNMTFKQAIELYPKAILWSILLSSTLIMEGYDVMLVSSFFALPKFNEKYGILISGDSQPPVYDVPAPWKAGLANGIMCGEILGLFINGIVCEKIGCRKTMMASLAMIIAFIFIPFFAPNVQVLLAGEILCGIPWGVFQTLTLAYASEVCPVALRAYLTTFVNLCWVIGQLIASGVLRGVLSRTDEWAYKIPFAIQWAWPLPILIGILFAPESPWWLVRKNRHSAALHSIKRLTSSSAESSPHFSSQATLSMMIHTNALEESVKVGTSYIDCLRGPDLRRTEITCITWLVQTICGSTFMCYSTIFFQQAGLPTVHAFNLSMAQYGLGVFGTIGSWFLMAKAGRRPLYLYGSCVLFVLLMIIGLTSLAPSSNNPSKWAIGSMLLVFTFVYDLTVGPVCYSLVSEISSTRLRAKTIVLARNVYNAGGIAVNILSTYQLTEKPTGWNWGAKSGFFWAGSCALCVIWIFFRLPEPKGRTYGEMDVLFERGVSARKFKSTKLDIFQEGSVVTREMSESESSVDGKKDNVKEVHVESVEERC